MSLSSLYDLLPLVADARDGPGFDVILVCVWGDALGMLVEPTLATPSGKESCTLTLVGDVLCSGATTDPLGNVTLAGLSKQSVARTLALIGGCMKMSVSPQR